MKKNWLKTTGCKTEKDYKAVMKRIDEVWDLVPEGQNGQASPEAIELDHLCALADEYEAAHREEVES